MSFPYLKICFLKKQKAPFSPGASAKYKPMKKENYPLRFTGFLAGVGDSTIFVGSLARGGTG
jgi:hypothetical protein